MVARAAKCGCSSDWVHNFSLGLR